MSNERPTLQRLHSLNIEKVVAKIYDNVEQLQRCSLDSTVVTKEIQLLSPELVTIISRNNSEATPEKLKEYLEQNNSPRQVKFTSSEDNEEEKRASVDKVASTNLSTVTELSSPFWSNEDVQSLKEDDEDLNKYATRINNNVYSSRDGSPQTNSLKNELLVCMPVIEFKIPNPPYSIVFQSFIFYFMKKLFQLEELPLVIEPEIKRKPKPQRNKSIKLSTKV